MDVVLIHPEQPKRVYQSLAENVSCVETPVWCGFLAHYLRERGHEVAILDCAAEQLDVENCAKLAVAMNPRLVAVVVYAHQPSASTHNMTAAGQLCREIEKAGIRTMMVGGHPSALPERTLREEGCSYVAIGEGAVTIDGYLDTVEAERYLFVAGLAWLRDGVFHRVPSATLVDINQYQVAWDLLPMNRYRAYNWLAFGHESRQPYAAFQTSLGCPYSCDFCSIQSPFRDGQGKANSYRLMAPALVGKQLEHLVKTYGVKHVRLADEMFILNKAHVSGICDEIMQRGLDLNIYVYGRADTCQDEALLAKMKRAGFNWVCLGFESASQRVRAAVGKNYSDEVVNQAVRNIKNVGINLLSNFIVGLPDDDEETMEATFQKACEINGEFFNLYCCTPYVGSKLYETTPKEHLPVRWEDYAQHSKSFRPLPTKHLTSEQVLKFRDDAMVRYFQRLSYQDYMACRFGVGALKDLNAIKKLERDLVPA